MNRLESRLTAQCAANNTVLWSTGASTNYIIVPTNLTQEYTAYCIEDGCSSVGTKLKIYSAPEISADLTRICSGQTVTLTAIGCDGTVSWFSGTGAELLGNNNPQSFTLRNVL